MRAYSMSLSSLLLFISPQEVSHPTSLFYRYLIFFSLLSSPSITFSLPFAISPYMLSLPTPHIISSLPLLLPSFHWKVTDLHVNYTHLLPFVIFISHFRTASSYCHPLLVLHLLRMSSSIALVCSLSLHPIHSFICFHHITIINMSFRILFSLSISCCSRENSSLTLLLSTCNGDVCSSLSLLEDLYLREYLFNSFILYYIILYYFILFYIILYYFILFYIILYYFILFYIILYYFILFYIILYYFILFYIILSFYIILYHFNVLVQDSRRRTGSYDSPIESTNQFSRLHTSLCHRSIHLWTSMLLPGFRVSLISPFHHRHHPSSGRQLQRTSELPPSFSYFAHAWGIL